MSDLLVVDEAVPQPSRDTASLRMFRLMLIAVQRGWRVRFLAWTGTLPPISTERLLEAGIDVVGVGAGDLVTTLVERPPDVVLASRGHVAVDVLGPVRSHAPRAAFVYDTLALAHVFAFRQAKALGNLGVLRVALELKRQELGLAAAADLTVAVSPEEAEILTREVPGAKVTVATSVHVAATDSPGRDGRRPDVVFIGYWPNPANPDAARVLLEEIWPDVSARDPELRLVLIGPEPPPWILERAGDQIVVAGHVADMVPWLEAAMCSVAPLRFGSGVKGKVLSCLAHGLPVVGSPVAWEGLGMTPGLDGMLAVEPAEFVTAILALRDDPELWDRLHRNGPALIDRTFSWQVVGDAFVDSLERAMESVAT